MRRLAIAALALLASCGGGGSTDDEGPVYAARVYLSAYHPSWPGSLAYTFVHDGVAEVHLRDDIDPAITPWWPIIAHELWHAAGFDWHLANDTCVTSARGPYNALRGPPCDEERAMMASVAGPIVVHCGSVQAVYLAVAEASAYWNDAVGFGLFDPEYK